jgi:hypothetical protein
MQLVVVERSFDEPFDIDELVAMRSKAAWCLDLYRVRYLRSFLSADCKRMLCLYDAPDAEAVRQVCRQLGAPYDRIWAATEYVRPPGSDRHVAVARSEA